MKQKRSPRFPFLSLEKSLGVIKTLHTKFGDAAAPGPQIAEALGYAGMNGKANKEVAALASYGLILRVGVEEGKRVFKLTARGVELSQSSENLEEIRKAALTPRPFHRIWFNRPGVTQSELQSVLVERGFTEEGAARAAQTYCDNVAFADLENAEFRESGVIPKPEPGPRRRAKAGDDDTSLPASKGAQPQRLVVPVGGATAVIPVGMSPAEFRLLMQTLRLWKEKLIV